MSLDEPLADDQHVDVLLNGRSSCDWLRVKWRNRSTLCFAVPGRLVRARPLRRAQYCLSILLLLFIPPCQLQLDNILKDCDKLDISIAINCSTFLGTRAIKCESSSPIHCGNLISSVNSAHYLCQSLGARSMQELDTTLARAFHDSLPDCGIFSYITGSADKSEYHL